MHGVGSIFSFNVPVGDSIKASILDNDLGRERVVKGIFILEFSERV